MLYKIAHRGCNLSGAWWAAFSIAEELYHLAFVKPFGIAGRLDEVKIAPAQTGKLFANTTCAN